MSDHKNSKWAHDILSKQKEDGSWGFYHSLGQAERKKHQVTTEQALRRLQILGYTYEDVPIRKAVDYLHACLKGKRQIPDRREKVLNWDDFTELMFSTWIRRFTLEDNLANKTAAKWAEILGEAFANGTYSHQKYTDAYTRLMGLIPRGGRLIGFVSFYPVSLLANILKPRTELMMFDYLLKHETGIYYLYDSCLSSPPEVFKSKEASRYLGAIELLSEYNNPACKERLGFVVDWLNRNREPEGLWDLGLTVKDGIYLPLSDSWRSSETRKMDCTARIQKLINRISISP